MTPMPGRTPLSLPMLMVAVWSQPLVTLMTLPETVSSP